MNALFLINPRSGARRRHDIERLIRAHSAATRIEILFCESKSGLDAVIADAAAGGIDVVYAVGGDGTVHEVAKRLIHTSLALGVLPTGSGNGFARHLGLPMEPRGSLQACRGGRIVTIDTAAVNGIPFLSTMGIGFDAYIAEAFSRDERRGLATYVRVGLHGFSRYEREEYTLATGGETTTLRALVIAVANSSQYGNNARIAPLASLQDGLLDITVIERASPLALVRLFSGDLRPARGVRFLRGEAIEIRRAAAGPAHLDGEPRTLPATLRVEIVPRSLRVVVPDAERAI